MIEWLRRHPSSSPFLKTAGRDWTYGETVVEVERRMSSETLVLRPQLASDSVFDVIAGISGGGAIVTSPGSATRYLVPGTASEAPLVVFTSGTTGPPKGVRLTLTNLEAASRASVEHLGHGAGDTWLLAMPLYHVGGLSILVRSAFVGGSVRMLPGFEEASVAAALHQDVTMVSLVPTMLRRLLDHDPGPYTDLRAALVGGGPIPDGLLEEAARAGLPVLPTYGMTETFGQVATLRPGSPLAYRAHPLPGVKLRIEEDGRIAVGGPQVSPGYLGEPDRAEAWLVTNDLGVLDEDGALRVLGRADTVIVSGGEKVDPEQVEQVLIQHPGVEEAVVVGIPDEVWGEKVVGVYRGSVEETHLAEWARSRLPGPMTPKRLVRVDEIPQTTLGKPDREKVKASI